MATTNKIKNINNQRFTSNLTVGNVYIILAETATQYSIVDDLTNTALYDKTLFKLHYEITKLNELLPSTGMDNGAIGLDTYSNSWKIISADTEKIRINSVDKTTVLTLNIPLTEEFGGTAFTLAMLTQLGFSIVYTQDPTLEFADRDVFITNYIVPNNYKYNETYLGVRTITDSTNTVIIENLVGLKITW